MLDERPDLAEHITDLLQGMEARWRGDSHAIICVLANVLGITIARQEMACARCGARLLSASFDASREMMFDECIRLMQNGTEPRCEK